MARPQTKTRSQQAGSIGLPASQVPEFVKRLGAFAADLPFLPIETLAKGVVLFAFLLRG